MKRTVLLLLCLFFASTLRLLAGNNRGSVQIYYTIEDIASAYDVKIVGWSNDGQWLAYFSYTEEDYQNGTIIWHGHFYNHDSGAICDAPLASFDQYYGNGARNLHNYWLADGRFVSLGEGQLYILTPCQDDPQTMAVPDTVQSIDAYSPYRDALLLRAEQADYLLTLDDAGLRLLDGIPDVHC